jgi:F420-dependent oxidoreductase-like protein
MRIGLQVIRFDWPGSPANIASRVAEIFQMADECGFYSLWLMDHFFQMDGMAPATDPMLEGYTTLGYLAGLTKQAKLGLLVTGVVYRHPGILVKTVSTLDVLSSGRAYLGIGAAWYEREARGLGVPFPPLKVRFEQLEETLQIAKHMWSGNTSPYTGRHYQLLAPIDSPRPVSKPHPPIMVGGEGEKKTLRLVAQYADACNLFVGDGTGDLDSRVALARYRLDVLKRHCDDVGRDYAEIERTVLAALHLGPESTPGDVIGLCRALSEVGVQHLIFHTPNVHEIALMERFGREIIPAVAGF